MVRNSPVNRWDYLGLNDCTHTIRVGHLFGEEGNWTHFNSHENDGSTCYIGCGMNHLNTEQGRRFPDQSAGVAPIPPFESREDENGNTISHNGGHRTLNIENRDGLENRIPDDYIGPNVIDVIGTDKATTRINLDRKIEEIGKQKCNRFTPCCVVEIKIDCIGASEDGSLYDPRCGKVITYHCGNPRGVK